MDNFIVLYNPLAGNGTAQDKMRELESLMQGDRLYFSNMLDTRDYGAFFNDMPDGASIIICGGDGTLNRFLNDTEDIRPDCDIYYYPSGSGKGNGEVNYTAIAIKGLLFHYKPTGATITVDGVEHRFEKVWLAPTMIGRYYGGGMMPTPEQDRLNGDGAVSVTVYYGSGKLKSLAVFPSIFKGEHIKHREMVAVLSGRNITVCFDEPRPLQIDGETVPGVREYSVTACEEKVLQPA